MNDSTKLNKTHLPFEMQKKGQKEKKILFRSQENYLFKGVLGGLAYFWRIDPSLLRTLFILLTVLLIGLPIIIYIILMKILPLEPEVG